MSREEKAIYEKRQREKGERKREINREKGERERERYREKGERDGERYREKGFAVVTDHLGFLISLCAMH